MMDDIRFNTHTDAPIRARPLHDAHVLLILMLFFIGVALPMAWHTVVASRSHWRFWHEFRA